MVKNTFILDLIIIVIILSIQSCAKFNYDNPDDPIDEDTEHGVPCPGLTSVTHYGKTYHTVLIGNQCWLKESLNIGTMISSNLNQSDNGVIEKYCYNNDSTNCVKYGGLYQWNELMRYQTGEKNQGLCPDGFHIPTDLEFKILEGTLDSEFGLGNAEWDKLQWRGNDAGGKLKNTGFDDWDAPNTGATNISGFTALPHCYREWNADISEAENQFSGYRAYLTMWTSTEHDETTAGRRALSYIYSQVFRSFHDKDFGYSVRCIKD